MELASSNGATTIATPLGNTILEIQGDLEIANVQLDDESRLVNGQEIRFGLLCLEGTQATMYIGKKQRLLGKVVPLEMPMGVLQFDSVNKKVVLKDVVHNKIIFKDRPLPIM